MRRAKDTPPFYIVIGLFLMFALMMLAGCASTTSAHLKVDRRFDVPPSAEQFLYASAPCTNGGSFAIAQVRQGNVSSGALTHITVWRLYQGAQHLIAVTIITDSVPGDTLVTEIGTGKRTVDTYENWKAKDIHLCKLGLPANSRGA